MTANDVDTQATTGNGASPYPPKPRLTRLDFFSALFGKLEPGECIELRTIRRKAEPGHPVVPDEGAVDQTFYNGQQNAAAWAHVWSRTREVYVGVCPRRKGRGTSAGVTRILAIWQDWDFKDPFTEQERKYQLMGLFHKPSMVVRTGGGFHLYWLLKDPLPASDKAKASDLMRAMARYWGADNVGDPARILRVPDTLNFKYDPPMPVVLESCEPERRYTMEQLWVMAGTYEVATYLDPERRPAELKRDILKVEELIGGVPQGQRAVAMFRLACRMRRAAVSRDMAELIVLTMASRCKPPLSDAEAMRQVKSAYTRYPEGQGDGGRPPAGASLSLVLEAMGAQADDGRQTMDDGDGEGDDGYNPRPYVPATMQMATGAELMVAPETRKGLAYLPLLGQPGYFIEGWAHLLAGYPRSGKTELLTRLCAEWAGQGHRVLYVTEEARANWQERVKRGSEGQRTQGSEGTRTQQPCHPERSEGSLRGQKSPSLAPHSTGILPNPDSPDPAVILRSAQDDKGRLVPALPDPPSSIVHRPSSFAGGLLDVLFVFGLGDRVEDLFRLAVEGSERVIIIDTLRNILQLEDETNNSRIAQELNPWIAAMRKAGKTLVVAHHMRKGSGDYGEGIAGGHALMGMFDMALELLRDEHSASRRRIRAYSRLVQTPEMVIEWDEAGQMRYLGDPAALQLQEVVNRVREVVGEDWLTTKHVREGLGEPVPSVEQVRQALQRLAEKREIERDPPLSERAMRGYTITWRAKHQAATEDGPAA